MTHPAIALLLLMTGALFVVGQLYITIPLAAALAERWLVSPVQASWVGSVFGFAYAAGFLLLGRLSDRFGRRTVLLGSLLATAAASILVASASSFPMLLGARAVQGLLAATFPPAALAWVADVLPPAHRPLGISLISFAFLAAAPLAQFLAAQSAALGLPTMMTLLAIAYLWLAIGLSLALPPRVADVSALGLPRSQPMAPASHAAVRRVWLAAVALLFAFVTFHAGAQALGLGAATLQGLRLAGLPPLLLSLAAARLVRRVGPSATARLGYLLAAAGLLVGIAGHPWALLTASITLSAGLALAVPGLIGTLATHSSPHTRAQAMSRYSFALFLGASLAPPLAIWLAVGGWPVVLLAPAAALGSAAILLGGTAATPAPNRSRPS